MTKSTRTLIAGAALLLASATQLMAGGLYVLLGNPEANKQARAMNAVVTAKIAGCTEPDKVDLSAEAIGIVDGRRQSIPLKLAALPEAGAYAVTQQWPAQGRWVLQFIARTGDYMSGTLVPAGPNGVERSRARNFTKMPAGSDIDALLAGESKSDVAKR